MYWFERERETSICCSTYLYIHWFILVCALTGDQICNLDISGRHFNQLDIYPGQYISTPAVQTASPGGEAKCLWQWTSSGPQPPSPCEAGESNKRTNCDDNLSSSSYCYRALTMIRCCTQDSPAPSWLTSSDITCKGPSAGSPPYRSKALLRPQFHGYKVLPSDFRKGAS